MKSDLSVFDLGLSVRAANCLNNADILTVGDLATMTEQEMLRLRGVGKTVLDELRQALAGLGLSFTRSAR